MPRHSLSEIEVRATRQRLCGAALALYQEEGAEAVTFRRLAQRMGTSHTQPYRYFENKQALFTALRLACYRRFADLIRAHDRPAEAPARRLAGIYEAIMIHVQAEPAEYQLMFSADQPPLADSPQLLKIRREAFDYLVGIVQQAVDAGQLDGDARDIMHVGWSAVHGVLNLHTAGQLVHGRDMQQLTWPLLRTVFHPLFEHDPVHAGAAPAEVNDDSR